MENQKKLLKIREARIDLNDLDDATLLATLEKFIDNSYLTFYNIVIDAPHVIEDGNIYQECLRSFNQVLALAFLCNFGDITEDIQHLVDFHELKAFNLVLNKGYKAVKADISPKKAIYFINEIEFIAKSQLHILTGKEDVQNVFIEKYKRTLDFAVNSKEYLKTKIEYPITTHIEQNGGLTLWDLFSDYDNAERVKQKLKISNHIEELADGKLIFKPKRPNAKYEIESLRIALKFNLLLKDNIELSQPEIIKMFGRTFHGFECDVRTITNSKASKKIDYYRALCKLD